MNLVCRFINDRDRAEEISQEVFLRVFRNRERYRKRGKFSTDLHDRGEPHEERDS